jgi:hypothetical protein
MQDILLDPNRCPGCSAALDGAPACPACGLVLRGADAARLWEVSTEIVRLQGVRARLIESLRPSPAARAAAVARPAEPPAVAVRPVPPPYIVPTPTAPAYVRPAAPTRPARPPRPRKEWTPKRVANVLLATGVALVSIAAIIVTAYTWGSLPIAARGGVMLAATAFTGWVAERAYRRGLTSSAEAVAVLAFVLAAIDAYAVRRTNLFGLGGTDTATYWSVATAVVAGLAAAYGRRVPVASARWTALTVGQLPVVITAARLDNVTGAVRGTLLAAQAAGLLLLSRRLRGLALGARVSGAVNWALAVLAALLTAYVSTDRADVRVAGGLLLLIAAVPLLWPGDRTADRIVTTSLTTATLILGLVGPARLALTEIQLPAAIAVAGLLAVLVAAAVRADWRYGPLGVGAVTVGGAFAAVAAQAATAVALPFSWLGEVWHLHGDAPIRTVLAPDVHWHGTVVTLAVVAVAAFTLLLVAESLDRRTQVMPWLLTLVTVAVLLVPFGFAWSYRAAVGWDVAAGLGALLAARLRRDVPVAVAASFVLGTALSLALASTGATLVVLLLLTLAYAATALTWDTLRDPAAGVAAAGSAAYAVAVAASRGAPADRCGFVLAVAACGLVAAAGVIGGRTARVVAGVAAGAYVLGLALAATDVGWLAWALGAGAVATGAASVRPDLRRLAGLSAALAAACAGATSAAYGAPVARTGFVVAVAGCVAALVGTYAALDDVAAVGVAAYLIGVTAAGLDLGWLSWALGVGAVAAGAESVRRRASLPVAAALSIACAGTTAAAYGAPLARSGFYVALAGCVWVLAGRLLRSDETSSAGVVGYVVGAFLTAGDPGWLAWALGTGAVTAAADAAGPGVDALRRRASGAVATTLGIGCAGTASIAWGAPEARTGLVVAAAACVAVLAGRVVRRDEVTYVGAAAYPLGLLAALGDVGWLSWALAAGAVTAAVVAYRERLVAAPAAALAITCVGTTATAYGAPADRAAFFVALAAAAAVGLGALLSRESREAGDAVEAVGAVGYVVSIGLSATDPGWLSWVLAAGGVTALADALRAERRWLAWVGGALLSACSWDRLYLEGVRAPEAYAAPLATVALVLGHLRRRRDESVSSWAAYGTGLSLGLGPSLWIAFGDTGLTRPLLLGAAALVVLLAGAKSRLQAPLTVGAVVLVVDALVQLAPVAAALPKWASIGAVGLLVIGLGATYEERLRDVTRLRETYTGLR